MSSQNKKNSKNLAAERKLKRKERNENENDWLSIELIEVDEIDHDEM